MDMPPPQTPTVTVQAGTAEQETARAALVRLANARVWFEALYEQGPEPTDHDVVSGVDAWSRKLASFWDQEDTETGTSRRRALAAYLMRSAGDEALVRVSDGTLDPRAGRTIARLTSQAHGTSIEGIRASELMLGPTSYAGALIIQSPNSMDLSLLFLPDEGWLTFATQDALFEYARVRFLESYDPSIGAPGLPDDDMAHAAQDGHVSAREVTGDVFTTLAERVIEVQRERMQLAMDDYALDRDQSDASTRLIDRMRYSLQVTNMLDVDTMLQMREARLIDAMHAERLGHAPTLQRKAWKHALHDYRRALDDTSRLRQAIGLFEPESLQDHVVRLLRERLSAQGIDADPRDIAIDVIAPPNPGAPTSVIGALSGSLDTKRISLVDLAYAGVGQYDLHTFRATHLNGQSLSPGLDHRRIHDMVRELRIGDHYQDYLESSYRAGKKGVAARALALHLQAARMRIEAEDARLAYYTPNDSASLLFDHDERGYRWIDVALTGRTSQERQTVDRHQIVVSQSTYKGVPIADILMFATRSPGSAPRVVFYTPDAPDGITFREFSDRQEAARGFLYNPVFREYLLDRLPAEFAERSNHGGLREFRGDKRAHWVLSQATSAAYTLTDEPFDEKPIEGDFLAAMYDTQVELRKRNARLVSRTVAAADLDSLLAHPLMSVDITPAHSFMATAIVELPMSAARAVQASWRLYDHVKARDWNEAYIALTETYVSALNVITPPMVGGSTASTTVMRGRPGTSTLMPARIRPTATPAVFEESYIAQGVTRTGRPDARGIHHMAGVNYIERDGHLYRARYDANIEGWRLERTGGSLDANFTGPAVELVAGQWQHARDVGLRGGMRRALRDRFRRVVGLAEPEQAAAAEAVAPVPDPFFPAAARHLQADVEAALADNPGARAMVRRDGTRFHLAMPTHSQTILHNNLTADLSDLSVHQRRMFMHELETRFPQPFERSRVIGELGFATEGRRVPSPPRSPARPAYQGDDGQVPIVSSTTADDLTGTVATADELASLPPRAPLTDSQVARWNEALEAARRHPKVAPRVLGANEAALAPGQVMPPEAWPERVWLYVDEVPFFAPNGGVEMRIPPRVSRQQADLQSRFRVTDLPPEAGRDVLDDILGVPTRLRRALDHSLWIEIDTRALREVVVGDGRKAFDFYRATNDHGGHRFSLRTWFHDLHLPAGSYRMGIRPD